LKHQLFWLSIFLLPTLASGQTRSELPSAQHSAAVESEIKQAIHQRLDALRRGDAKTYLSYFGDDCIVTGDNGALIEAKNIAKEWVDDSHSGILYKGSEPMELTVHAYGDMAVASFRVELDEDWVGQKVFEASRINDVFAKRGGKWLLVAHHETPIPNARRVAAKVDPKVFDAYVGEYQITPNYIVKVKREGDKLMDQWPGDAVYTEDVPVSESTFVARGELGEVIYVKDDTGKVTHFILRNGLGDLIATKIK
jgi:ketosteroid isomerase-like protein